MERAITPFAPPVIPADGVTISKQHHTALQLTKGCSPSTSRGEEKGWGRDGDGVRWGWVWVGWDGVRCCATRRGAARACVWGGCFFGMHHPPQHILCGMIWGPATCVAHMPAGSSQVLPAHRERETHTKRENERRSEREQEKETEQGREKDQID